MGDGKKQPVNWPTSTLDDIWKIPLKNGVLEKLLSYWEGNFSIFGRVGKKECLSLRFNSMVRNGWVSFPPTKKWLKRGVWKVRWKAQIFWFGDSPMVGGFSVHLPAEWWGCFPRGDENPYSRNMIPGEKVQPFLSMVEKSQVGVKKTPENSSTLRIQESIIPANYSWGMIIQTFFFPGAYLPIPFLSMVFCWRDLGKKWIGCGHFCWIQWGHVWSLVLAPFKEKIAPLDFFWDLRDGFL